MKSLSEADEEFSTWNRLHPFQQLFYILCIYAAFIGMLILLWSKIDSSPWIRVAEVVVSSWIVVFGFKAASVLATWTETPKGWKEKMVAAICCIVAVCAGLLAGLLALVGLLGIQQVIS